MTPSIRLGRLFGIEIGVNWSLIFIFALVAWTLATQILPYDVGGHSAIAYWIAAVVGAVAFYGCLLAHEMSHALMARRSGVAVAGITLWLFGGVSRLEGEPSSARSEAAIAGVGPLTSFVIAAIAYALTSVVQDASPIAADVLAWLAVVNVALGLFNLVPAFPLDGGRLLSAFFWWRSGSRQRGVHSAVRIGRVFAYLMIGIGAVMLFTGEVTQGIWLAFIGWFLLAAGSSEEAGLTIRAVLRKVPVSAAMSSPVVTVPDWLTVQQFFEAVAPQHHFTTYPIHEPSGKLTGVVHLSDLVRIPPHDRGDRHLIAAARPISAVPTTTPDEGLAALIERIGTAFDQRVLVFDRGELVGIVAPVDVARVLTARQSFAGGPPVTRV